MVSGVVVDTYDDALFALLDLIRAGEARTRPELARRSGEGRKLVTQRLERLIDLGLVVEGDLGPSNGGRAPRELRFRADAGHILVAVLYGYTLGVGLADLTGRLVEHREVPLSETEDPDDPLGRVEELFDEIIAGQTPADPPIWGVGLGVFSPVDATTGRPFPLPRKEGWADYGVRDRFASRYALPVWVDNEANLMALGEFRGGLGRDTDNLVFVNLDRGIGCGLISDHRLHRGSHGMAGELGHTIATEDAGRRCWCGNPGCLMLSASGESMVAAAARAAEDGTSPYLASLRKDGEELGFAELAQALAAGDAVVIELFNRTGNLVGRALANLVSVFDPSLIVLDGPIATAGGNLLLAAIRQAVYERAFPAASRDLHIALSPMTGTAGLVGASFMVSDQLLSREHLPRWIDSGSPAGRAALLHDDASVA